MPVLPSFRRSQSGFRPTFRKKARTEASVHTKNTGRTPTQARRRPKRQEEGEARTPPPKIDHKASSNRILTIAKRAPLLNRLFHPFFLRSPLSSPSSTPRHSYSTKSARYNQSPWNSTDHAGGASGENDESPSHAVQTAGGSSPVNSEEEESLKTSMKIFAVYKLAELMKRGGSSSANGPNSDFAYFEDDFITFACRNTNASGGKTLGSKMGQAFSRMASKF